MISRSSSEASSGRGRGHCLKPPIPCTLAERQHSWEGSQQEACWKQAVVLPYVWISVQGRAGTSSCICRSQITHSGWRGLWCKPNVGHMKRWQHPRTGWTNGLEQELVWQATKDCGLLSLHHFLLGLQYEGGLVDLCMFCYAWRYPLVSAGWRLVNL